MIVPFVIRMREYEKKMREYCKKGRVIKNS